jgi:predicted dehydrogenase
MARIGIIGTGWGARVQVPTFREAGHEVVAIAGKNHERTVEVARELEVRPHGDWSEIVSAPDIDLVSIVTPPAEHRQMALAAITNGKHVLCEKPTALDAGEAAELAAAARLHPELVTLIDHELRFLPSWRQARTALPELGPVRYAEVRYSSPARGDRSRSWNWWSDAAQGGGIWGAVGSHFVDALRYFGLEVESVAAMLRVLIDERPSPDGPHRVTADDFAAVSLAFTSGASGVMTFSAVSTGPDEASMLTIHCERGAMRFRGEEVLLSRGGSAFETFAGGPMQMRPGNSPGGAFGSGTLHLGHALRVALDDGDRSALAPAATFEDGLAQQRVLDAARASSSRGGVAVAVER